MVELNSNPEVLLKKRKNADRIRIEKQAAANQREKDRIRKKAQKNKNKFVRAETLVAKNLATKREGKRIERVLKVEETKSISEGPNKHYFEKIEEDGSKTRQAYSGNPTLYFVVRVPGPLGVKIPEKCQKILQLLRLTNINTGVFVKLTETIYPLLKLISPYTVVGKPSLQSVRQLLQKRATITIDQDGKTKTMKLNDNNLVEEKLGDEGIICIEDIIHEIVSLGENFKTVTYFLDPFKLGDEIYGYGPLAKLRKLEKKEQKKENKTYTTNPNKPVFEIDIDQIIATQN